MARAEAVKQKAADAAAAKAAHGEKVRTRESSAGAMSASEIEQRRSELDQLIRKKAGTGSSSPGGSFLTAAFLCGVAITLAYFVVAAITGGDDAAKAKLLAPTDIAIAVIALGAWLRHVTSRSSAENKVLGWKRELAELPFKRGCGNRSCAQCYSGTGQ